MQQIDSFKPAVTAIIVLRSRGFSKSFESLLFCCKNGKLIAIAVMPRRSGHQIIVITTASGAIAPALILYSAFSNLVGITIIETLPHQVAIFSSMTLLYFH
jgi:hypothetical protein